MSRVWFVIAITAPVIAAAFVGWLWWSLRPVQRREVERFVRESSLLVTVDSGPRVVDAIARTRFWRAIGVTTAFTLLLIRAMVQVINEQTLTVSMLLILGLLFGHYVGSVVAEFRTAHGVAGPGPRSASLVPRATEDYIGPWAWRWPRLLGLTGLGATGIALATGEHDVWVATAGLGSAAVAATTAVVTRYVLERPQRAEAADLQAADDAIRSRSLHVLAGSAVGIQLWLTSLAVGATGLHLIAHGDAVTTAETLGPIAVVFAVTVPLAGTVIGRRLTHRAFPLESRFVKAAT